MFRILPISPSHDAFFIIFLSHLYLQLTDGKAEVFGTEIAKNKKYEFPPGSKTAIFTWHGCKVTISFYFCVQLEEERSNMTIMPYNLMFGMMCSEWHVGTV